MVNYFFVIPDQSYLMKCLSTCASVCDLGILHLILPPSRYCAQQNVRKGVYSFLLSFINIDVIMSAGMLHSPCL